MAAFDSFPAAPDGAGGLPADSSQALLDALPWGVLVLTPAGTISYLNGTAARLWGVPVQNAIGQAPAHVQPAVLPPALLEALTQPTAAPTDYWLPHTQQWIAHRMTSTPDGQHWVFWDNVTARHQAEAGEQRSSQLLLDMEAVAHTGSYEADLATGSFYFSNGMYRLFGETPQTVELTLALIDARSHPDDAATVRQVLEEAVRTKQPYTYRRRIRRADGEWRTLEAHGEVRTDAAGTAVQLRGLVQDVTKRVLAEQASQEASTTVEHMLNGSISAICILEAQRDDTGRITDFVFRGVNRAAEVLNQKTRAEMLGRGLLELFAGVRETLFAAYVQVVETGEPARLQQHYAHEHYNHWFDVSAVKHQDGFIITFHDITAQKTAEQELQASYELLQRTIDSSLDMVQVFEAVRNEQGEVVDFRWVLNNAAAAHQYGNVIGQRLLQLNPGVIEAGIFDTFKRVLETGVPNQSERHYVHEQFNGWFHQSIVKLDDGVTTTTRNITERKQAEQELREMKELLQATLNSSHYVVQAFKAVRDASGKITDFTWILTNQVWQERYGGPMTGKSLLQENPGVVETGLFDLFVQVTETGVPIDHEQYYAYEQFGGWFHQTLVQMGDGFVMNTIDITERKKTQEELLRLKDELAQKALDRYRTLFETIDEGFCVMELVFDDQGQVADLIYREVNAAFEQHTGFGEVVGKRASEIFPRIEAQWVNSLTRVQQTGVPERLEGYNADTNHWFTLQYSRVGGAGSPFIATVFNNITERKQREQRQEVLLKLSDAFRAQSTPAAIGTLATHLVADYLRVDRCYIVHFSREQEIGWIGPEYRVAELPPLSGEYRFADFPEGMKRLETGPLIIRDLLQDPSLSDTDKQSIAQLLGVHGLLAAVLRQGERNYFWCLTVATIGSRDWTDTDLKFLEDVAERTWAAVERARAEEALAISEQRLRTLIANLPGAAAFVVGPDLRYQVAGGEALDLVGLVPADLVGRTVAEAMPPELAPQYEAHYRQALGGQDFSREHTARGRTFVSRGVPLPGPAGQPEAVLVVSYDITERKQAEEALQVSETKYRTLFETMDQGFGIGEVLPADEAAGTPIDWQWLEVNPQFERLTGLPRADVLSQTTRQLIPDLEESWYERYAQAAAGETVNFESYSPVLDRWFDVYAFALGPPDNRRVAVLFSNTSERKQVEAALRQAEERYRQQLEQQVDERTQQLQDSRDLLQSVLNNSPMIIAVLQAVRNPDASVEDFVFTLVNQEQKRVAGRSDLVGQSQKRLYPGVRKSGVWEVMLRALATGQPQQHEYYYPYEGVNRWFISLFGKLGDSVVSITLDITATKLAEQERLKNLRLLEQAEAVAGLGSWDYDLATGALRWSDGMYHLYSLPEGSAVAPSHYLDAVLADERPRAEQLVRQLTAGHSFEETLHLHVGKQIKTVRMKAVVLPGDDGQPVRVLGVDLEISELQRLEADNLRLRLGQQQALFEAVQAAQETERKRIAEGLHNGIGQLLYATKLRLDRLPAGPLPLSADALTARHEADALLSDAIRQTRRLSHELVPLVLEEFGLEAALQDICRTLSSPALHFHCHVNWDDEVPTLARSLQLALYRMAQELGQNVVKHARGAPEASLELETTPGWVLLRVEDNGVGFTADASSSTGLGLRSIRDRVALLGGQMQSGTASTGGAYVRLRIPLPDRSLIAR